MAKQRIRVRQLLAASIAFSALIGVSGCTAADASASNPYTQVDATLPGDVTDRLDAVLQEAVTQSGASGGVAGVWAPWSGEWTAATGTTSFDEGAPEMTTDAEFRMGVGTGAITCTVLLGLVDDGVVGLDDHVSDYVSNIPGVDGITLRQLCQGTSGLANFVPQLASIFISNPSRDWPQLELLASGLAAANTGDPGEVWSYSDTGIDLLALALEYKTQKSINDLYNEYVFDPLGVEATGIPDPSGPIVSGVSAYASALGAKNATLCEQRVDVSNASSSMGWAASGGVSTLNDQRELAQAIAAGSLLSDESAAAQWTTVPMGASAQSWQQYGLGAQQQGAMRGYASAVPGFSTAAYTDAETGLTVVISVNNSTQGSNFIKEAAFRMASIASRAPGADGAEAPIVELPWSEQQATDAMTAAIVCETVGPVEEAPAEEG